MLKEFSFIHVIMGFVLKIVLGVVWCFNGVLYCRVRKNEGEIICEEVV